ncbi:terminase small subunit, partial [Escherichia coli]
KSAQTAQKRNGKFQKKKPVFDACLNEGDAEKFSFCPDEFGISDQLMTFAQFVVDGKTRVEAYRLAGYKGEGNTAYSSASRMLRNARVSRYVHHLRNERQKRYSAELDDVITQLVAIINADPNEIAQYRRVNCRYCWGENHKYQWRDLEEQIRAEKKSESENKPPPDLSGGIGFVDNADPNPDCPRCNGEGKGEVFFADTRDLEGDARYLLQGVKLGKFGIEITTADKDAARRELARLLVARGSGSGTGNEKGSGKGGEPTVIIKLVNSPDGD